MTVALFGCLLVGSTASAQTGPENLVLSFENLAPLDEDVQGHYEGWAIVDGNPVSTGKFNVNMDGEPVGLGGGDVIDEFDAGEDISGATDIKISIEPPGDNDEIPSGLIIVDGEVMDAEAMMKTSVPGLETLETMTTGEFILATPSDNPDYPDNDNQGIWWLTMPGPEPGLMDLPDIGPNWKYEGWVVDVSNPDSPIPYTTGTFTMAEGFDSDEAGCNGGGPPFPGQDFVEFQCPPELVLDTGNFAAVISIEPEPDALEMPFQLKPLAGPIPEDAVGQNNAVNNQVLETFPTGTALLYEEPTATETVTWGRIKTQF
ncbi:MAG: hypothetical protein GF328_03730 [Candidatus Latescibacteria bacterium]|nr:hypothetical protein [Candidatus Latescibacterota bacterium]